MARPKGSKDKAPRKQREDFLLKSGAVSPTAPFGLSVHGVPLLSPRTRNRLPKTKEGKAAIIKAARALSLANIAPDAKKAGRPEKPIDEGLIQRLASICCTDDEIASIAGVDRVTLDRRFRTFIDEHRDRGRMSLRRTQLSIAMGQPRQVKVTTEDETVRIEEIQEGRPPNAQMAIHLGKHWLGQKDNAPTNNILVQNGAQGPSVMSEETEHRLALLFLEICPEAAQDAIALDPSMEVSIGA